MNDPKDIFQSGIRNERRSNPVTDQPLWRSDRAMITYCADKNLAGANPTAATLANMRVG